MRQPPLITLAILLSLNLPAQDSVRVLCLYGSVPAKGYKGVEPQFHKGMFTRLINLRGGHVGVETGADTVLSFHPIRYDGPFHAGHIFNHPRRPNSLFRAVTVNRMWYMLPHHYPDLDSLRRVVFVIPITPDQRRVLDSLALAYLAQTPYDYAFLGMRCASASYEVLASAGIVTEYKRNFWYNIFTTRRFRYILYKEYLQNKGKGWRLYTCKGSQSREWEKDQDNFTQYWPPHPAARAPRPHAHSKHLPHPNRISHPSCTKPRA